MTGTAGGPLDLEVGIVNTNNATLLRTCLASLGAGCGDLKWRVTVLDNASTDDSVKMIQTEFPGVNLVLSTEKVGYARTLNQLARPILDGGTARYVAFVHEDVEVLPGTLEGLVRAADADPTIGLIGPAIRDAAGNRQESFLAFPSPGREAIMGFRPGMRRPLAAEEGWLDGPCLLLRVEALRQVRGFDERFFIFFEDVDMARRLSASGWKVKQDRSVEIVHRRHGSTGQSAVAGRMEFHLLRSRYLYFEKHFGRPTAHAVVRAIQLSFGARAAKALVMGRLRNDADEARLGQKLRQLARYHAARPIESHP